MKHVNGIIFILTGMGPTGAMNKITPGFPIQGGLHLVSAPFFFLMTLVGLQGLQG